MLRSGDVMSTRKSVLPSPNTAPPVRTQTPSSPRSKHDGTLKSNLTQYLLLPLHCQGNPSLPRWPRLFARLSTSICLSKELRTLTTCQSFEQFGKGRRALPEPETLHEATMQIAAALNLQSQPANSSCHRTRAAPLAAPRAPSCHPSRLPVQTQR